MEQKRREARGVAKQRETARERADGAGKQERKTRAHFNLHSWGRGVKVLAHFDLQGGTVR